MRIDLSDLLRDDLHRLGKLLSDRESSQCRLSPSLPDLTLAGTADLWLTISEGNRQEVDTSCTSTSSQEATSAKEVFSIGTSKEEEDSSADDLPESKAFSRKPAIWPVHAFVLCGASSYFDAALDSGLLESSTRQIKLDDCEEEDMKFFIEALYGNQWSVGPERNTAVKMLQLGKKANVG
ncbi:MAG: BTB/POZ domain-containing protein [Bacteroidota bacterium]